MTRRHCVKCSHVSIQTYDLTLVEVKMYHKQPNILQGLVRGGRDTMVKVKQVLVNNLQCRWMKIKIIITQVQNHVQTYTTMLFFPEDNK